MSKPLWRTVLREPLVHFLVLGLLIAAVDIVTGAGRTDDRVIKVSNRVTSELTTLFREAQGREPDGEELSALIERWLENEIMYREARSLSLDEGDEMIRERLILKMRNVLGTSLVVPDPSEDDLRAWLDARRDDYVQPARYDMVQFYVGEADARERAVALSNSLVDAEVPAAYTNAMRRYQARTLTNINALFGAEVIEELISASPTWRAIESPRGWHLARIERVRAPVEPEFETLRETLRHDWARAEEQERLAEAFQGLRDKYDVEAPSS